MWFWPLHFVTRIKVELRIILSKNRPKFLDLYAISIHKQRFVMKKRRQTHFLKSEFFLKQFFPFSLSLSQSRFTFLFISNELWKSEVTTTSTTTTSTTTTSTTTSTTTISSKKNFLPEAFTQQQSDVEKKFPKKFFVPSSGANSMKEICLKIWLN